MARPHAAVYLSCILPVAFAIDGTVTLAAWSPSAGIGLKIDVGGCKNVPSDADSSGCETNETAMFKIKDDSTATDPNLMLDTFCNAFDSWTGSPATPTHTEVTTTFFYAFSMTAGDVGKYWLGASCILEKSGTASWPGTDQWDTLDYTDTTISAYSGLPTTGVGSLSGNATDIYVPLLLWATPHSPDAAFPAPGETYRAAQWAYVGASQKIELYFNEAVTHTTGKSVFVYSYKPGMSYLDATKPSDSATPDAFTSSTTSLLGTKVSMGKTWTSNRLYKVLVEAGAFKDLKGNAFAGVNGRGRSVSDCWSLTSAVMDRDCMIAFAVPMTITAGTQLTHMPAATAAPIDVTMRTSVTKETNVIFEFSEAVYPGTVTGVADSSTVAVIFERGDAASTPLQISGSAKCIGTNCWSLFGSTSYILEPAEVLTDSGETVNSTEVTVSFSDGVFDYVEGFSYSFLTNVSEYFGNAPQIYAYQFSNGATDYLTTDGDYYVDADGAETQMVSWAASESLVLYFDTKVTGVASKYVVFYPEDESYAATAAGTKADGVDCFTASNGATDLRPCQLAADGGSVTVATATGGSKVTITPGQLIPGQTYNVTVQAGAFAARGVGNGATAEFTTKFYVPLSIATCQVSDNSSPSRVHRTSSVKMTFDGPAFAASSEPASISMEAGATKYAQGLENADEVFYRNNPAATTDKYMMIIQPRADALVGLPANEAVDVSIPSGVLKNFATASVSACSTYTTLYEDAVQPKLLTMSNIDSTTTYGLSGYTTTSQFSLTFSEDVQAATSGSASLINSVKADGEYHFRLGSDTTVMSTAGTSATISGRTVTLTVSGAVLATGSWTLDIPYSSLTDTATDTGMPENNEFHAVQDDWDSTVTVGTNSVSAKITLSSDGTTAPGCTVYSPQVNYAGTTANTEVADKTISGGSISRTLVLSFDEAVKVRGGSISLYAENRTTGAKPKILDVNLDTGGVTCSAALDSAAACTGSETAAVDFYWLEGCPATSKSIATGCLAQSNSAIGGDKLLFLFLMDLDVLADFSNYYFYMDDSFSIVTEYDYPTSCLRAASDASFVVFNPDSMQRTDITTVWLASSTKLGLGGGTENVKLEFSEPVDFGNSGNALATIEFRTSFDATGTKYVLNKGNTTHGVVLSASGKEAVVQVPYPATGSFNFDYLTVTFGDGSFVDLSPTTGVGHDYTNATTLIYNSTVANAKADINQTWSKSEALRTDTMAPEALMLLPDGAVDSQQVLTGINVTAKLYILMSENVTVEKSNSVKVKKCANFADPVGVTGFGVAPGMPLMPVTCASASTETLQTVAMLDQSVVEVSLKNDMQPYYMYSVTIEAGAFKDKSGVASAALAESTDWMFFTEGTWKVNTAPTVLRYTWSDDVDADGSSIDLLTVWFDQPVGYLSGHAIAQGLADAGESATNSQYNSTTLDCAGGYKCTVKTTQKLKTDTTYLVKIPDDDVTDREGGDFAGLDTAYTSSNSPPVAFKTKAVDSQGPKLLFCADAAGTSTSVSMRLGFSEPVVLYGGYTEYTDSAANTDSYWCLFNTTVAGAMLDDCESKVNDVKMTLEDGGMVVAFTSSGKLITTHTATRNWGLYVDTSKIKDKQGNPMDSFDEVTTRDMCGSSALSTSQEDTTVPTYSSSVPATAATTVHDGDFLTLTFSEEVTGAATAADTGYSATLSSCSVQSSISSKVCEDAVELETAQASALYFGNSKALWQFAATLEQGVIYQVSTPANYFADLAGNNDTDAHVLTFQVALESWDYRSRTGTDPFQVILVNGARAASTNTVPVNVAGVKVAVDVYFGQKVKTGVQVKAYVNRTDGTRGYLVTTATTSEEGSVSLSFQESTATPLVENEEYELTIYKSDKAWSTSVFTDADEYYTYFGNYKSQTALNQDVKEGGTHVVFTTGAEDVATYLSTPELDTSGGGPIFLRNAAGGANQTVTVSSSPMIEVKLQTNATVPTVGDLTVYRAARVSASSLGESECDLAYPTYATCCATSWTKEGATQTSYVSYASDYTSSKDVSVFYSFDGGLEPYMCYRVSISSKAYKNSDSEGTAEFSASYATWFTTSSLDGAEDYSAPTLSASTVSSQGDETFTLVATTAFVSLTFSEAIESIAQITFDYTGGAQESVTPSVSGDTLTAAVASGKMSAGKAYTVTVPAAGVKDAAGNYLNSAVTFTFTTVFTDSDTPTVLHALPEDTETVSVDSRMVLFMSESVQGVSGTSASFSNADSVDMTQSAWADFQEPTDKKGVVVVEGPRVAFASFFSLKGGSQTHLTTVSGGLKDYSGHDAAQKTMLFTAESFGAFASLDTAAPYDGNEDVRTTGATAVSCGDTVYLVGGGRPKVCKWGPSQAWSCADDSSALGSRSHASVAVDQDCALWVVGGSGDKTNFVKSTDATATEFVAVTPDPLPVQEAAGDFSEGTSMPDSLPGASVAILKGWQAVICGGGQERCWVCIDEACGLVGKSGAKEPVPEEVVNRYYGTMVVVERDLGSMVYMFGGQNKLMKADAEVGAKCYQSVFMWDFSADLWAGMSARISNTARCGGAYAQAGDGLIVVVGGTNTTKQTNTEEYGIGAVQTMLQSVRPLADSDDVGATTTEGTYATGYARPLLFAHGPTSADIAASAGALVTLAFSEPIQGGDDAVCVTITSSADTTAPLHCSAGALTCRTGACDTSGTSVSTTEPVKIVGESMVTIDIGTLAVAGATITVDTKTGTDGFVKDFNSNDFVATTGATFSFSYAVAAAPFVGTIRSPTQGSPAVALDTNLVYEFNEALDSDSIAAAFSLTVTPAITTDADNMPTITYNENHTEAFTMVGGILKVSMGENLLVPGMTYTSELAAGSVVSGAAKSARLTASFTALNGPASAGVAFEMAEAPVDDTVLIPNDTTGNPTIVSVLPVDGMTGVHVAVVDVEFTFSEAVTFADVLNVTAGEDIPKAFELKFWNTTSSDWDTWKELQIEAGAGQDVFVNTTSKKVTIRLEEGKHELQPNTQYRVGAFQSGVITDYRSESSWADEAATVWAKLNTFFGAYSFTTVGTVEDTAAPALAAYAVSPLHDSKIILDDGADTVVQVVFDKPLGGVDVSADTSLHTDGAGFDKTKTTGVTDENDVLTVTIDDFPSSITSWNLYMPNAMTGANFVNMTAFMPSRVTLEQSKPSGTDADRFSSLSTVVLEFSEVVQAGEGTVTLTAVGDASDSSNTLTFSVGANGSSLIRFTGVYMVLEPDELMPGEVYDVSMTNETVRGATGRFGIQESSYVPSTYRFATVPEILFAASDQSIATQGAGVTFGPDSALLVIGGETDPDGTDTNMTMASTTYRDHDALAGDGKGSVCGTPCDEGAVSTVERKIYKAPSACGLRQMNIDGVYVSTTPEGAKGLSPEKEPVSCVCPTCMYGPPEIGGASPRTTGPPDNSIPVNGHFDFGGEYTQTLAANVEVPLKCNVGPDMDPTLKETQGYEPAEHFRCTIASMTGDYSATAEYFGVWRIAEDACAEKPCLTYPDTLGPLDGPLPTGYSTADCSEHRVGGNYSMTSGANCSVTCTAGYKPTAREFVCDRGIYSSTAVCAKRTCSYTAGGTGVAASFAGTVDFEETLSVECEPGYEPDVGSAVCEASSDVDESDVALNPAALSCKPKECATPTVTGGTANCAGKVFGETCDVVCDAGKMPNTASATITCDTPTGDKPSWSALECIPVACDTAADKPWEAVAGIGSGAGTCSGSLAAAGTCQVPCADGKEGPVDGTSVMVECIAETNAGALSVSGACVDIVCSSSKVAGCEDDSKACGTSGGPYTYACGAGNVIAGSQSATAEVQCTAGGFKMELSDGALTDPTCAASGSTATAVTKTVVTATFKVSPADKETMCANMDKLAQSMADTICTGDLADNCPDVEASSEQCDSSRRARRLTDAVLFAVDFAIATDDMSAEDSASLTTVLTDLSSNDDLQATLQEKIKTEVGVEVLSMEVSEPKTVVEYEVTQPSGDGGDGGDDGGFNPLIIVGLLVVLALGFGAFKMKGGSSS